MIKTIIDLGLLLLLCYCAYIAVALGKTSDSLPRIVKAVLALLALALTSVISQVVHAHL